MFIYAYWTYVSSSLIFKCYQYLLQYCNTVTEYAQIN